VLFFTNAVLCMQPAFCLEPGIAVFPRYHPSPRTRAARSFDAQLEDWRRIGAWMQAPAASPSL